MEHAWLVIYVGLLIVIIAVTGFALRYLHRNRTNDRTAVVMVFALFAGALLSVIGVFLLVELLQNGVLK